MEGRSGAEENKGLGIIVESPNREPIVEPGTRADGQEDVLLGARARKPDELPGPTRQNQVESIVAPAVVGVVTVAVALGGHFVAVHLMSFSYRLAFLALVCLSLAFMLATVLVDPGVLAPAAQEDPLVERAERGGVTCEELGIERDSRGTYRRPRTNPRAEQERYCIVCKVWRPKRASHCSSCGMCIERHDHHCSAIGTCIGAGNHRFFVCFLISIAMSSCLCAAANWSALSRMGWPATGSAWRSGRSYAALLLALGTTYSSGLLFFACLHCWLMSADLTSRELFVRRLSPWHKCTRPGQVVKEAGNLLAFPVRSRCTRRRRVIAALPLLDEENNASGSEDLNEDERDDYENAHRRSRDVFLSDDHRSRHT